MTDPARHLPLSVSPREPHVILNRDGLACIVVSGPCMTPPEREALAARIVLSVNARDALVAAADLALNDKRIEGRSGWDTARTLRAAVALALGAEQKQEKST